VVAAAHHVRPPLGVSSFRTRWPANTRMPTVSGAGSTCSRRNIAGETRKPPQQGRHPMDESLFQRALAVAVRKAGLAKRVTSHTFRHSFAAHLLASGYDIRTVQELLGHKDVRTTMIYTHVLNRGGRGVRSPADSLPPVSHER